MICALLAPLALAACAEPPGPPVVTMPIGHWSRVGDLRLRPDRVVEDSRCPMNARCIQAGRAIVRLTLHERHRTRRVDVTLGESIPVRGGQLALVAVAPEKMAGAAPLPRPPYRFTFELRR